MTRNDDGADVGGYECFGGGFKDRHERLVAGGLVSEKDANEVLGAVFRCAVEVVDGEV